MEKERGETEKWKDGGRETKRERKVVERVKDEREGGETGCREKERQREG